MKFVLEHLRKVLGRLFEIRQGETKRVLLLQANIFLIVTVILILKPIANALFLDRFGVMALPRAFILVAVFAALLSYGYSRLLPRASLLSIIQRTYIVFILSLVGFGALHLVGLLDSWILYAFYIEVALFAVLSASQFWILVNVVLNVREAKRLFGFIGAGAIAGGIFGGYLTSIAAPIFGSENLLFLCAIILMICLPITNTLWKRYVVPHQTQLRQIKRKSSSEHPYRIIRQSRHLSLIAGILAVSVVVSKLVDFQFSALASATYTDSDELASFFGFWFSTMNIISLLIQLFLTKNVVGRYGVGFSLFLLPLGILLPEILILIIPKLWVAILLRVNEGSLKQSVNKAGIELLALPIPLDVKNQTKTFIDVFVDSLATGVGGLILIICVSLLEVPMEFISVATILLVILWLYMARKVRTEYLRSFQLKVAKPINKEEGKAIDLSNESVLGGLKKVLTSGTESEILFVLKKLKETNDQTFIDPLKSLLAHPNHLIRAEALGRLYFYKGLNINDQVRTMIKDSEDEVRIAAFEYLIEHSSADIEGLMRHYLVDEDPKVRSAALMSLAIETRDNLALKLKFDLSGRLARGIERIVDPKAQADEIKSLLMAVGHSGFEDFYPTILAYLRHEDRSIAVAAIKAAAQTMDPDFILPLIELLSQKDLQQEALTALDNFGPGAIPAIAQIVNEHENLDEIRNVALLLERKHFQSAVDLLFQLIAKGDIATQAQALRSLNQLKTSFPHLNFYKKATVDLILTEAKNYTNTLSVLYAQRAKSQPKRSNEDQIADGRNSLVDLLERRLDGNLERIFYLLGLKYSPPDILSIYDGIQSKKQDIYVNAIEFLDNLLDSQLKKVLMPLVETALLDNISKEAIDQLNIKIPTQYECFELILAGKDQRLKLAVLHLVKVLKDVKYLPLAMNYVDDQNAKISTFAKEAAAAIRG